MSTFIAKEDILSQDFQEKKTLKFIYLDLVHFLIHFCCAEVKGFEILHIFMYKKLKTQQKKQINIFGLLVVPLSTQMSKEYKNDTQRL